MAASTPALSLIAHPYDRLIPVLRGVKDLRAHGRAPGAALVWHLAAAPPQANLSLVERRPGGLALLVVLPPVPDITKEPKLIELVQAARPQGILPYHVGPRARDLAQVLRRPPDDLPADVTEYLAWRGLMVDGATSHLVRRVIELSADLRSIAALSRSMYMSRRALGRRLMSRGLPVPSHWLQVARLLRVSIKLQNSDMSVLSAAYEHGYPDGFSVSNQMYRLTGYRPSDARKYLGWEWLFEAWLRTEAETGGLAPGLAGAVRTERMEQARRGARARPPRRQRVPDSELAG